MILLMPIYHKHGQTGLS